MEIVHIHTHPRHFSKLKRGHKVRWIEGKHAVAVSHEKHKKISKAFMKGKGINIALSPDEIHHNHGKGFFDDIGSFFEDAGNTINQQVIQPALPVLKKIGTAAVNELQKHAGEAGAAAGTALALGLGQPELVPLFAEGGQQLGNLAGNAGGDYLKGQINGPTRSPNAPPSRQPETNILNEYNGTNMGHLDKASAGNYFANLGLSQMEDLVAQKRKQLNMPHFDYSGGQSLSQYADAVPQTGMGLYAGGSGLGGDLFGDIRHTIGFGAHHHHRPKTHGGNIFNDIGHSIGLGLGGSIHPSIRHKHLSRRREKSSIGIQGTLLGHTTPPALVSQPLSANFMWGHTLPPAYQNFSKHTIGGR